MSIKTLDLELTLKFMIGSKYMNHILTEGKLTYLEHINSPEDVKKLSEQEMKLAAARAIASCVPDDQLSAECIMPVAFDPQVIHAVAAAVAEAARKSGVARI